MVITRAPDVHLRRWLVHFAAFFKTKRSKTLPMLKSSQIKLFWHLEGIKQIRKIMIFQNRGRPQGNIPKKGNRDFLRSTPPAGQHSKNGQTCFSKIFTDVGWREAVSRLCDAGWIFWTHDFGTDAGWPGCRQQGSACTTRLLNNAEYLFLFVWIKPNFPTLVG